MKKLDKEFGKLAKKVAKKAVAKVSAARGPLMMEAVLSALHSLRGKDAAMSLEIGASEGKIGLFARSSKEA